MSLDGASILFVNNFARDFLGGGEVHLLHLVSAATSAGMRPTVLAAPGSALAAATRAAGAIVIESTLPGRNPLVARNAVCDAIEASDAWLVQGTGYFTNLLTRMSQGARHPTVVNTLHTMPLTAEQPGAAAGLRASIDRLTAKRVDAFVADAQSVAKAYVDIGLPENRMHVIHNAVDPAEIRRSAKAGPVPGAVAEGRRGGGPLLVVVGRLEMVKGIYEMLDAMQIIAAARPDATLLWAGAGDLADEIASKVSGDPVLREYVRILGYVENAHALLAEADLVVMPSRAEGFNTTILEAMALGKPVAATAVGGTPEAVSDGETGVLVPPADSPALSSAILSLLDNPGRLSALGEAGRLHVEEHFTVAGMKQKYLDLYAALLTDRS